MTQLSLMALFLVLVNSASAVLFFRAARRRRDWWRVLYGVGIITSIFAAASYAVVSAGVVPGLPFEWGRWVTLMLSIVNFGMALFGQLRGDEIR